MRNLLGLPGGSKKLSESGSHRSSHSGTIKSLLSSNAVKTKHLPSFLRFPDAAPGLPLDLEAPSTALQSIKSSIPALGMLGSKSLPKGVLSSSSRKSLGRSSNGSGKREEQVVDKSALLEEADRLMRTIDDEGTDPEEALFTTDKDRFTRDDLRMLLYGPSAPKKFLQAYLSHLGKVHGKRYARGKTTDRVKIYKVSFASEIFNAGRAKLVHCSENVLKLE